MNVILVTQFLQAMKLLSVKYTGTGVSPQHAKVLFFQLILTPLIIVTTATKLKLDNYGARQFAVWIKDIMSECIQVYNDQV